ncbi:MAG: YhdP family protein [Burkholderiales bacterium]
MAPTLALRLLRVAGNVIVAAVVLVCTLLLAVRFVVFPALDDYRDRIAATLTRQLGQPVTIAGITGSWDGWNPRLAIAGFAIHDRQRPDAPPVLSLPQVDLVIAWTSLLAFDVRLKELAIERPELFIRRDTAGRLHVAGIEIDPDTQSDDAGFTDWLLRQRLIVVRDALVSWNDELRRSPQLVLDHVMFRLERGFNVHRFGLTGSPPADLASPLDFRGEVGAASFKDWRQAKGRFFVRLDFADVGLWREWVPLLQPVEAGQGALRLWFDFAEGKPTNMVADLELTDVRARARENLPALELTHVGGRVAFANAPGKREITTTGFTFTTAGGATLAPMAMTASMTQDAQGAITGGQVAFDHLEVAPLSFVAEHLPLSDTWRRDLAALALRGSVSNGRFAWTGPPDAPTRYSGSGAFARFGITASEALPGAASVSGDFTFDEAKGDLKLDSRDMRVTLPHLFTEPLQFDSAVGRVGWSRTDDGIRIALEELRFATPHTSGTASGSWRSQPVGPGRIDLKAQLVRADARNLDRYLPLTLSTNVRDWLRQSIRQGQAADVRMALAGDLADFPFPDPRRGQFSVTFRAVGVTLDYAQGWPAITDLDANVRFEGTGMFIEAKKGRVLGTSLGTVKADIPHLGAPDPLLTVAGEATGPTSEFLAFVAQSPVERWTDHALRGVHAVGDGRLALKFALPLVAHERVKVDGDYEILGNQVRFAGLPALTNLSGHVLFDQDGVRSRDLALEVLGGKAHLALSSAEGVVRVNASGVASVANLKSELDWPLMNRVSGSTDWELVAQSRAGATSWTLTSNLRGAAIDLPAPLGKPAQEAVPLRVDVRETAGKPGEDALTVDYRNLLRLAAHRNVGAEGPRVDRALLLVGDAAARGGTPDRPGLWVRGQIADLDLDEWLALYAKEFPRADPNVPAAPGAFELNGLDLAVGRLDVFARVLHDLSVNAIRSDRDWRLRLDGREVEGTAVWRGPGPGLPNGRVQARLARFTAPGPDELNPVHSEIDPRQKAKNTWPALDIEAESFQSRSGRDLGALALQAEPTGADWHITKLSLVNPAGRIDANGWWRVGRDQAVTDIELALDAQDAGAFLERFGYPVAVRNAPTKITGRLTWNGAPNDFDYPTLAGNFALRTGAGQFTKIDPGMGKLLSLLSLQALPRRITLDFRDVFSEGFAFDEIAGTFKVENGLMRTRDLALDGPAAAVTITGEIDLARETTQLDVRVKPALSTTFSAGAAALFIANPLLGAAVGAGTLLAQKLLDNPLGSIFSYDYRVTGSWSDPHVERVGARAVPAPAAAGAAAPAPAK